MTSLYNNFKENKFVEKLILDIVSNRISKYEAFEIINSKISKELFVYFKEEFEGLCCILFSEFFYSLDNDEVYGIVKKYIKNGEYKKYLKKYDKPKIEIFEFTIREIEGIKTFFNCFIPECNDLSNEFEEFLFLNDLLVEYESFYVLTGENKKYEITYEEYGNLKLLKIVKDYILNKFEEINVNSNSFEINLEDKINDSFNPNHFNQKSYNLFLYLVENYLKKGKVKWVNIFKFMKKDIDKDIYVFGFTQDNYKSFIQDKHKVDIKKMDVAKYKFLDIEKPILITLEQQFREKY